MFLLYRIYVLARMYQRHVKQLENGAMPATLLKIKTMLATGQTPVSFVTDLTFMKKSFSQIKR